MEDVLQKYMQKFLWQDVGHILGCLHFHPLYTIHSVEMCARETRIHSAPLRRTECWKCNFAQNVRNVYEWVSVAMGTLVYLVNELRSSSGSVCQCKVSECAYSWVWIVGSANTLSVLLTAAIPFPLSAVDGKCTDCHQWGPGVALSMILREESIITPMYFHLLCEGVTLSSSHIFTYSHTHTHSLIHVFTFSLLPTHILADIGVWLSEWVSEWVGEWESECTLHSTQQYLHVMNFLTSGQNRDFNAVCSVEVHNGSVLLTALRE